VSVRGLIVFDGNSLTAASYGTYTPYPLMVDELTGHRFDIANVGVGGQDTQDMTADGAAEVDAKYDADRACNICVPWECRNDIVTNEVNAATAVANYWTYCDARQTAGWQVVAVTMLPSDSVSQATTDAVNALIRAEYASHADALADVEADSRLDDNTDTDYFLADATHLTNSGLRVVAETVYAALSPLLPTGGLSRLPVRPTGTHRSSPRDKLSLYVGATAPEVDLLKTRGVEVDGLQWSSVLPGGHASLSFAVSMPDPLLPVVNALKTDAKVWLKYGDQSIWQGWVLPLETEVGATDGTVRVECAGTLERYKRNQSITYTWVDADPGNWFVPADSNSQISVDQSGQLLLYLNKNSSVEANKAACLYYWVNNGLPGPSTDIGIHHIEYDVSVDVGAANWFADISADHTPWEGSWTVEKSWTNTTATATDQTEAITAEYEQALRLRLYSNADVDTTAAARWVKLSNVRVCLPAASVTIDDAMDDLFNLTTREDETLDSVAHLAYRQPTSAAAIAADIVSKSSSLIDWALWGDIMYCKARPSPSATTTVALRRSDLLADAIHGDYESAVDGVMVVYASDGTVGNAPVGTPLYAEYGSTTGTYDRTVTLDYHSDVASAAEAAAYAQQEYTRINGDVYRGSVTVRLDQPLANTYGAPIDPLLLWAGRGWAIDRTYQIGHSALTITGVDFDLDGNTATITVGPQEERQIAAPFELPAPGVTLGRRSKWVGKGRRRRRVSWWEFG